MLVEPKAQIGLYYLNVFQGMRNRTKVTKQGKNEIILAGEQEER
jgi:hypothetical protein